MLGTMLGGRGIDPHAADRVLDGAGGRGGRAMRRRRTVAVRVVVLQSGFVVHAEDRNLNELPRTSSNVHAPSPAPVPTLPRWHQYRLREPGSLIQLKRDRPGRTPAGAHR